MSADTTNLPRSKVRFPQLSPSSAVADHRDTRTRTDGYRADEQPCKNRPKADTTVPLTGMDIGSASGEAVKMTRWTSLLLATSIVFSPSIATACLYPPPAPREAGETDEEYSSRSKLDLERYLRANARKTEASYFDEAEGVYLARVVRSEEIDVDGSPFARQAVVIPVQSVKGRLPSRRVSIRDRELTSCGLGGDGPATSANVGQMVIVFDGVRNEGMDYRSRIYAILAGSAQEPRLSEAWSRWKRHANGARDQ